MRALAASHVSFSKDYRLIFGASILSQIGYLTKEEKGGERSWQQPKEHNQERGPDRSGPDRFFLTIVLLSIEYIEISPPPSLLLLTAGALFAAAFCEISYRPSAVFMRFVRACYSSPRAVVARPPWPL